MTTPSLVGVRLRCAECGTEVIVIKGGEGAQPACCGKRLEPR